MKVYIVLDSRDDYPVKVFDSAEKAKQFVSEANEYTDEAFAEWKLNPTPNFWVGSGEDFKRKFGIEMPRRGVHWEEWEVN